MDPVEVTVKFDTRGGIKPQRFIWHDQEYPVLSTGRTWVDEDGHHILVMVPGHQVYELVFASAELRWYLKEPLPGSHPI